MVHEIVELYGPVLSRWRGRVAFFDGEGRKTFAISEEPVLPVEREDFLAWCSSRPIEFIPLRDDNYGATSLLKFGGGDVDLEFRLRWL